MNKKNVLLFGTIIWGLLFAVSCDKSEKTLVLQPDSSAGKDALILNLNDDVYVDSNFGTHTEFQASAWTSDNLPYTTRGLIQFDLSEIPVNTVITSADLYLFAADNTVNGPGHSTLSGTNEFLIQKITSAWEETTVTWNNQPTVTDVDKVQGSSSTDDMQDYILDITELAQYFVNNPTLNHGIMIQLVTEEYYRRILFASSDNEDAAIRPKLVVDYKTE